MGRFERAFGLSRRDFVALIEEAADRGAYGPMLLLWDWLSSGIPGTLEKDEERGDRFWDEIERRAPNPGILDRGFLNAPDRFGD